MPEDKVAVLVPAYNEEANLGPFLDALKPQGHFILVVDDGSRDHTAEIARSKGVEVLSLVKNGGKGKALRSGFQELLRRGYEWIAVLDGDGQHLPEEIGRFIKMSQTGPFGVVSGDRLMHPRDMPPVRLWTNRFMSSLLSFVAGQKIEDTQCGFKLISAAFLKRAHLTSDHYEIESEILLEAARLGYKITSISIQSVYGQEKSRIRPLLDTFRFIRFLVLRGLVPRKEKASV